MSVRRVDIIGAGISGLSTAYYLIKTCQHRAISLDLHIWEKEPSPGGLAGCFLLPDVGSIEKFYHHFYRQDVAIQELIVELGLETDIMWRPAATGAYYFRQPYRLSSPLDVLRFKPLSVIDRFRLGLMVLQARRVKNWQELDDITAKNYIIKTAGEQVYRVVWEPLFHGKFGTYADDVSAAWLWSKLVDRGGSRNRQGHEYLGYLRGGLGRLFDRMIDYVRQNGHHVHLGQAIQGLEGSMDRIERLVTDAGTFRTDLVIGCVQTPDLTRLLPTQTARYRNDLEQIGFLANVCLIITLKRSLSDFYWTNVADADAPFVGIIEQTKWVDPGDYRGKHVVYISAYVPQDDSRLDMTAKELIETYLPAIRKMFPDFGPELIEHQALWMAPYAQPVVRAGYRHVIPKTVSPISNLFVCTMAQIYPNDRQVSNGVALAKKTAAIIEHRFFQA